MATQVTATITTPTEQALSTAETKSATTASSTTAEPAGTTTVLETTILRQAVSQPRIRRLMKKLCFFLITFFCVFSVYSKAKVRIKDYNLLIEIDEKIEDLLAFIGEPNEISCIPFDANHDWDTLRYKYNDFWLYFYRAAKSVYRVSVNDKDFDVLIQNNTITYGEQKYQIEKKIGEGEFLLKNNKGYNVYLYSFVDFLELHLFYDGDDKLCGVLLGYSDSE